MDTLRKNAATFVAGIVVVAALAVSVAVLKPWQAKDQGGARVVIHDGNGEERSLSLDEDATIEVATHLGANTVVVEDGTARITAADCPKHSCTHQQPISRPGEQLVCLPHQLWVEVVEPGDKGTQLDEAAVTWTDSGDGENAVDVISR